MAQLSSLRDHLEDPRAQPHFSIFLPVGPHRDGAVGRHSLAATHRYGQFITSARRKARCYTALRNTLMQIDPEALAAVVSAWLQCRLGEVPKALALDGKWVRDRVLTICLTDHETGAPLAVGVVGKHVVGGQHKSEGEQAVARQLYASTDLRAALVTADALHNSRPETEALQNAGADYLIQLKQEIRDSHNQAEAIASATPFWACAAQTENGHGRFETRQLNVQARRKPTRGPMDPAANRLDVSPRKAMGPASLTAPQRQARSQREFTRKLYWWRVVVVRLRESVRPKSGLGKACTYLLGHWAALCEHLRHGETRLDNNLIENAIRPSALGKKNWLCVSRKEVADDELRSVA